MTDKRIENINIDAEQAIITPNELKDLFPLNEDCIRTIAEGQQTIKDILVDHAQKLGLLQKMIYFAVK